MTNNFPLGTEVVITNSNWPKSDQTAKVVKVGRKNVQVEIYGRLVSFDMETGVEARSVNAGGPASRIFTPEMLAERRRHQQATARLRELGLVNAGYGEITYAAETIERIIEILESAK